MIEAGDIKLKPEHTAEIYARLSMIEHYKKRLAGLEEQDALTSYTERVVEQAFRYVVRHGVGRDMPHDVGERAILAHQLAAEHETASRTIASVTLLIETLREALTFFLAECYGFDPLRDAYELDVDNGVLRKVSQSQEKGGQSL